MQKRTDVTLERILPLLAQGMTQKEVAAALGCAESMIWYRLKYKASPPQKKKKSEKNCSCCNSRRVTTEPVNGHILTRLCSVCFSRNSNNHEEIYNVL